MTIQESKDLSISTVTLNHEVIQSLSDIQLHNWLYYFSKFLLTTRLVKLTDLSINQLNKDYDKYFQPLMILGGKTIFSMKTKELTIEDIKSIISLKSKSENK